ncbi:MAG: hypothetical protein M3T96_03560, partial [Acidobacteriota bacterium]|nr:hypothetical protein [Acidobacteriota bacterium]
MLFFGIKNWRFRFGVVSALFFWMALFIGWMAYSHFVTAPHDPRLTGTADYGRSEGGDFASYTIVILVECGVLLAVLLPYSFSRYYWIRPLVLQPLFGIWLLAMAITGMHGSQIHGIHILWLLGINIFIFLLLIASIIAEVTNSAPVRAI